MNLNRKEMEMIKNAINVKVLKLLDEMEEYEPGSFLRKVAEEKADEYVELYVKMERCCL